jgi:class 3 adenylate cyclase
MNEVRALLLTDVVDSTQLSQTLGDAVMAELWAAHDRVARDLLAARGGREIDKTDGMLLLFDAAADALTYAADYHRALKALPVPLSARAGLHVGPVILRENSAADIARGAKPLEVDGIAKPTTARVMALAQGGQTLLTEDARQTIAATSLHLCSHGYWVLKGLAEPVELFEAGDADGRFDAPPDGDKAFRVVRVDDRWLPVRQVPNNLPQPLTSFIGRLKEICELRQLLGEARLLTLTGSGGCGKTRLALQMAHEGTPAFPDGVWLVELAALSDPLLVPQTLAKTLGLKAEPSTTLTQTVVAHLDAKHTLLVLDNAEHVLAACAELADAVLQRCQHVTVVVTSREELGVSGDQRYRVPSLSLPDPRRDATPQSLAQYEAVRLFVDRARSHAPQFTLTRQNAPAVASICHRLDGIPFAIELAAARLPSLAVDELNARLDQRFRILTGGSRTALPRQQTLRALIDWSHDLLSATEQALLRRLSGFACGWTRAVA